jgi:hypothetical protein
MTGSGVIRHLGGLTVDYAIADPPHGLLPACHNSPSKSAR